MHKLINQTVSSGCGIKKSVGAAIAQSETVLTLEKMCVVQLMLIASKLASLLLDTDPRENIAQMFQESHKNVHSSLVAIAKQ